ncbi:cell wall-binding repeat-containing protein [Ornithinimicrobium cerasi]|uniref:Cell wall-binding protein n=1 Tax=Ornithinimicrobium cerasi TaxID=2248773 RepID=A0A285VSB6_9MICO|nr:cell wall-binding repeat-containing protein [Ornithinimicrobium cerasi]SOC56843.1 Putative cell wall-binding protein [Ornithinimicrobium cerasi]
MSRRGSSRPTRSTRPARLAAVSAGLVLAVAATTAGVGVDQAGAPTTTVAATPPEIVRHIGSDRFGTAVEVALAHFGPASGRPSPTTVYLATGRNFPDALTGGALAGARSAPVLLTRPDSLPGVTGTALTTLDPQQVVLLGGETVISREVVAEITALGIPVRRIGGGDRYETAALVSRELPASDLAYVVTGLNYPDALSAAPVASLDRAPVLLTRQGGLPGATAAELRRHDPRLVIVMGGEVAVAEAVLEDIRDLGIEVIRIRGNDRYQTAAALMEVWPTGATQAWVATGLEYADALAAAPAAALRGSPVLLTRRESLPGVTGSGLVRLAPDTVIVPGGYLAITEDVDTAIRALPWE